ncbi:hypothetical protein BDZ91DRAFT_720229 [Kalaharituber pfeilii]|nr:hypothetical protein BDZ91DRAFT_720229 [Kalaharituber pfeilii]
MTNQQFIASTLPIPSLHFQPCFTAGIPWPHYSIPAITTTAPTIAAVPIDPEKLAAPLSSFAGTEGVGTVPLGGAVGVVLLWYVVVSSTTSVGFVSGGGPVTVTVSTVTVLVTSTSVITV